MKEIKTDYFDWDESLKGKPMYEACVDEHEWGFVVINTKVYENIYVDFKVFEVCSKSTADNSYVDLQEYLTCSIKWDSCSHFWFPSEGYIHMCGVDSYIKHCQLLKELYAKAFELMGRKPESGEEWPEKS